MNVQEQIREYIDSQAEPKRSDLERLHLLALHTLPGCTLWFESGKDSNNKIVANPNIGYGFYVIKYADGKTRDFFRVGISGNKTGISVYIMGIKDKTFLARTYGATIGKASVTGYCIKFKALKDINLDVLEAAIRYGGTVQHEEEEE